MGENVVNHPQGRAAQMLTRVIVHVLQAGDTNVRLSEAAVYAQKHNITVPPSLVMNHDLTAANQPDPITLANARTLFYMKFGKHP